MKWTGCVTAFLLAVLFLSLVPSRAGHYNGYFALNGANLDWALFPWHDWHQGGREEFAYYLDHPCKELNINSIRILLWPKTYLDTQGQMLVEFCDELEERNMACLFWISTTVPSTLKIHTRQDIAKNRATYDELVRTGKNELDHAIGYLAHQRPRCKAVLGWSIGDGEAPYDVANLDYFRELARHARQLDPYHPVGKEIYNSIVKNGQICGLKDMKGDPDIAERSVYDDIDYIGYANYHLSDGVTSMPLDFREGIEMVRRQNPDHKPVLVEEYGFTMDNDPRSTFNTEIINREFLDRTDLDVMGSFFWTMAAEFNPNNQGEPAFSSFLYDPSKRYGLGETKDWAKVFALQTHKQPLASFLFEDRYSEAEAFDYSGHGRHLRLVGGAVKAPGGRTGRGLKLVASAEQYGTFEEGKEPAADTGQLFFRTWVKPDKEKEAALVSRPGAYRIGLDAEGRVEIRADVGGGWAPQSKGTRALPAGKWSKVTVTYDRHFWRIYVDNQPDGMAARPGLLPAGRSLWFIGSADGKSDFLDGMIDEIIIAPGRSFVAGWSFDGDARDDHSPNGYHLTLHNFSPETGAYASGPQPTVGQALRLDGVDDFATAATSPELRGAEVLVDLYMAAYRPQSAVGQVLVSCGQGEKANYGSGWNLFIKNKKLHFTVNLDDVDNKAEIDLFSPDIIAVSPARAPDQPTWYHVRASFDGHIARLWVNGHGIAMKAPRPGPIVYRRNERLTFGQFSGGGSPADYFDGLLDEVKLNTAGFRPENNQAPRR